jgi:hypothetical protein
MSEGQGVPTSDLVDANIWDGIMHLPEDVSIRISDHNGVRLRLMHQLWEDSVEAIGDPISRTRCTIAYWKRRIASKEQLSISCMDITERRLQNCEPRLSS